MFETLAHHPVTPANNLAPDANPDFQIPWFMRRDFEQDSRYLELADDTRALAADFMRDGFIVIKGDIDRDLCDATVSRFNQFTSLNHEYFDPRRDEFGLLHRIINLHLVLPDIFDVFSSASRTLALQDALFNAPTSVYTTLYYERGSSQPVHRDTPYFTTRPEYNYFGTWFALEDAHSENGCLEVIRSGHLIPEIDRKEFAKANNSSDEIKSIDPRLFDLYQEEVARLCQDAHLETIEVPLEKGDVLIWHPQLPHGGSPIRNRTLTRHSIVAHTVARGTPVYQAEAFFNPEAKLSDQAGWPFEDRNGRSHAVHGFVDVMHVAPRRPAEFRMLD